MNKAVLDLMNEQVNKELASAYLYLAISNDYATKNLNGFANYFKVQAQEELDHALLFNQYLQNNGLPVQLMNIELYDHVFLTHDAALLEVLKHEKFITDSIHKIYETAFEQRDYRTLQFLDWFVKEQGEEEKNAEDLIHKYKLFAADGKGLYLLDQELSQRVYVAPSLVL